MFVLIYFAVKLQLFIPFVLCLCYDLFTESNIQADSSGKTVEREVQGEELCLGLESL